MTLRSLFVPVVALLFACGSSGATSESASGTEGGTSTSGGESSSGVTSTSGFEGTGTEAMTGTESSSEDAAESSSTGDDTTGSTGDDTTSGSTSTGDETTGSPIDCAALPQGPLPYTIKPGVKATEDLAFDDAGNLVGAKDGNLFRTPFEDAAGLWIPNAGGFIAGLRMTAKGVLVFADSSSSTLFRVDPGNDFKEMVVSGLDYPNGVEVDLEGFVYVAEQNASRVRRVDPATGQFSILAEGLNNANGLSFSPDYRTLYVGSFGGGTITALHLKADMTVEGVSPFMSGIGGGALDGMAVDECGNVYVCEFVAGTVWRITPDGVSLTPLVELGEDSTWIPNMQWGSGLGGWDSETLYVLDISMDRVFAVPVGVGDKPRAYP